MSKKTRYVIVKRGNKNANVAVARRLDSTYGKWTTQLDNVRTWNTRLDAERYMDTYLVNERVRITTLYTYLKPYEVTVE